ncbi:hypothetical protein V8E51_005855 [Hyaloscypha variabilis]
MVEARDEPWDMKTALRRSRHIIHIHMPRKPSEGSENTNAPPLPIIAEDILKLKNASDNYGFVFIASIAIGLAVGLSRKQSPSPAAYPGLAVSGLFVKNVTQWNMQLFYQDIASSAIHYCIFTNTINYSAAQVISLSHEPTQNVPIAATSFENPDGTTFHNIFYILKQPNSARLLTNAVISNNLQHPVAADSSTAAVFFGFGANKGFRIFYHTENHSVTELTLINGTQQETVLSSTAVKGSNLAAVTFSAPGYIQVVCMDAQANTLYTIENFPGNWLPPTPITALITPSLALSYAFIPDYLFLFYTTTHSTLSQFTAYNASQSSFPAAISSNATGRTTERWTNTLESSDVWVKGMGPGGPVHIVDHLTISMEQTVNGRHVSQGQAAGLIHCLTSTEEFLVRDW